MSGNPYRSGGLQAGLDRAGSTPRRGSRAVASALVIAAALAIGCDTGPSAEEQIGRARTDLDGGKTASAIIGLKSALQRAPDNADARWLLGRAYLTSGDGAAAQKEIERARDLGRSGEEVELALLRAELLQRRYGAVLGRLATSGVDAQSREVRSLRAEALLGLGRPEAAEPLFRALLAEAPDDAASKKGLARSALMRRDFPAAESVLGDTDEQGGDLDTVLLRAQLALSKRDTEAARRLFERALELDSRHSGARLGLVKSLLAQGKPVLAFRALEPLYKRAPGHPLVNYFRGIAGYLQGDYETAAKSLTVVLRAQPGHPPAQLVMGAVRYAQGDLGGAVAQLEPFRLAHPEHVPAAKLLAAAHLRERRAEAAVGVLAPLAQTTPGDAQLLALLGSARLAIGDYDGGTADLHRASELAPQSPALLTQLALGRLAQGREDEAIEGLRSAVGLGAESIRSEILLTYAHLRNGDARSALETADAFAERRASDPVAHNLRGAARAASGDRQGARAAFREAIALQPDYVSARLNLARLEEAAGDHEAAALAYRGVMEVREDHRALEGFARIAAAGGRYGEAIRLLERARALAPGAVLTRVRLSEHYLRLGRGAQALAVARETAALAAGDPTVELTLARALLHGGEPQEALEVLGRLRSRQPDSAAVRFELASARIATGDARGGRELLEQILATHPDNVPARVALGAAVLGAGDPQAAIEHARRALAEQPGSARALDLLGAGLGRAGDVEGALDAFTKAHVAAPSTARTLRLARVMSGLGRGADAVVLLERRLASHPDEYEARLALGNLQLALDEPRAAIATFEVAVAARPDDVVALNNLAWLYLQLRDPRAPDTAKRVHDLAPERAEVQDTYGWTLVRYGQVQRGLQLLSRAADQLPSDPNVGFHRAFALAEAGERARARDALAAILSEHPRFQEREEAERLRDRLAGPSE